MKNFGTIKSSFLLDDLGPWWLSIMRKSATVTLAAFLCASSGFSARSSSATPSQPPIIGWPCLWYSPPPLWSNPMMLIPVWSPIVLVKTWKVDGMASASGLASYAGNSCQTICPIFPASVGVMSLSSFVFFITTLFALPHRSSFASSYSFR